MKSTGLVLFVIIGLSLSCVEKENQMTIEVFETSASGNKHQKLSDFAIEQPSFSIEIHPQERYQEITGFGGSFTESSAYLLNQMSEEKRREVIEAYFGDTGAKYSLTRTHINSCDFSLRNYAYVDDQDVTLSSFSIEEDMDDIIPMINDAMATSTDGFKLISSPWTAPPWMKDNNNWVGGKLLKEHYATWAKYFSLYIDAYQKQGIDIWGVTFENEPLGNGNNWESMHYTPEEMVDFVQNHLGPQLQNDGHQTKILGYDQNRDELKEWATVMYQDEESSKYFDGIAVHWYASTVKWFGEVLEEVHNMAPEKFLIETEGCVDAQPPAWKDDEWYWRNVGTDWGWTWAPEEKKADHPKYVPVYRYARDMIGCLNNWVDGWVDWNMVLDKQGGPNWKENWCVAPVIVDPATDEVYYTPLYYTMKQFSRYIRPGATRIGFKNPDKDLMVTAVENTDGSVVVIVLNMGNESKEFNLQMEDQASPILIQGKALQTIVINNQQAAS